MYWRRGNRIYRRSPAILTRWIERERKMRRRISDWLSRRSSRLKPATLRWLCYLFVLGGCLLNTWIIVSAFRPDRRGMRIQSLTPVPTANWMLTRPPSGDGGSRFRRELDSINADPVLKRQLDSLLTARPGFADTLRELERIYPAGGPP
jgi:hypothetical protein